MATNTYSCCCPPENLIFAVPVLLLIIGPVIILYTELQTIYSRLNRPKSVSLASLARQLYIYIVRANFVLITRKEGGA